MSSELERKPSTRKSAKPEFKQSVFINHTFSEDDKRSFKTWAAEHGEEFWLMCDKLMDDGYSLSVKPDAYSGGYASYITPVSSKGPNNGFILSGRSRSSQMAVLAVLYRHYVLFEGDWPGEAQNRSVLDDE